MRTIKDTDKQNNINTDIPDLDDDQVVGNGDLRLMILVSDTGLTIIIRPVLLSCNTYNDNNKMLVMILTL